MVSNMKKHKNSNIIEHIIYPNGHEEWYQNDKLHRDGDKPAVCYVDGSVAYFIQGKRHRDNDLPAVIKANGDCEWYIMDGRIR